MTPSFKITESTHTYNCVVNSLKMAGFSQSTSNKWNILWTGMIRPSRVKHVNEFQRINHFAGSWSLGRKDNMWRNVQRMRRLHGKHFDICPQTYIFPEDYKRWCMDREASQYKHLYIMKPAASSCGRGIRVIGKTQQLKKRGGYVICKYVSKPHLLNGYKYDLRLYVVVTSFEPLKIYLFREGLVRKATVPYSTSKSSLKQRFVHLTNYSVNKKAEGYVKNDNKNVAADNQNEQAIPEEEAVESKLNFSQLRAEFIKMGCDYEQTFANIQDLLVKAVLSAENPVVTAMGGGKHKNACFEIYGFDVLIDSKMRPWLLEVNVAPSLSSSSQLDKQIKTLLLSDSLYLTGFHLFDRKKLEADKAKKDKQRLLGFDSSAKNPSLRAQAAAMSASQTGNYEDASEYTGGVKSENSSMSPLKLGKARTMVEPESAGLPNSQSGLPRKSSTSCQSGNGQTGGAQTNRQIRGNAPDNNNGTSAIAIPASTVPRMPESTVLAGLEKSNKFHMQKARAPKPFLKDTGEWTLLSSGSSANADRGFGGRGGAGGCDMIQITEADMEMLADYEEEQQRKGHFTLLFPRARNIDEYKGYFSQQRRQNLILWEYLKQGAPSGALHDYFKNR